MRVKIALIICTVLLFGVGCNTVSDSRPRSFSDNNDHMTPEKVSFNTEDGVTIVADYYQAEGQGPSALLLHMMPATKESWREFAAALLERGFSRVLAIDLRGHGESRKKGDEMLDYQEFEDEDHQQKMLDVRASVEWLDEHGVEEQELAVVGASIGANLAIAYGAENYSIPAVVALSPGLNYRGVTTVDKMGEYQGRNLYIAASKEDEHSYVTVNRLKEQNPDVKANTLEDAGHGTTMFEEKPEFMQEVLEWSAENTRK